LRVLYCSRSPRICAWGHPGGSPDDYRSRGPATRILEYLLKQLLPIPPVPASFARTEDFAPPIAASHSHPYPSKHALRSTILLGAVYLLGTSSLWRAAIALALALLGLLASRVLSRDALDLGRRGRSVAGCQRDALGLRERGLAKAVD
jgi:hypothetical protein